MIITVEIPDETTEVTVTATIDCGYNKSFIGMTYDPHRWGVAHIPNPKNRQEGKT